MEILIYLLSALIYKKIYNLVNNKIIINILFYYYFIIIISFLIIITKIYMYLCINYDELFKSDILNYYLNYLLLLQESIEIKNELKLINNTEYTLQVHMINNFDINIKILMYNNLINTLFFIYITSTKIPYIWCELYALHNLIIIPNNEISLLFFRIYNPNIYALNVLILYFIYPSIFTSFIIKLQCFCYDNLFLFPLETLELPILMYLNIDNNIMNFIITNSIIKINYLLLLNNY